MRALVFSLLIVLLGVALANTNHPLSLDSACYVQMASGDIADVPPPYRYRLLVPSLAHLFPFSPAPTLRCFTYLFLWLFYCAISGLLGNLKVSHDSAMMSMVALLCARCHLYEYQNPWMTDAAGLLFTCLMLMAYAKRRSIAFTAAGAIGLLARETPIFLLPAWLFRDWRKGGLIAIALIGFYAVPRLAMKPWAWSPISCAAGNHVSASYSGYLGSLGSTLDLTAHHPLHWLQGVVMSYGVVWVFAIAGSVRLRNDVLMAPEVLLILGAFASSLIATDTERMMATLAPVIVVWTADFFGRLKRRALVIAWIALLIQLIFGSPYLIGTVWWYRKGIFVATLLSWVAALVALRDSRKTVS